MSKGAILFSPGPFGGAEKLILESTKELGLPILLIEESRNPNPAKEFELLLKESAIPYTKFVSNKRYDKKLITELNQYIATSELTFVHSHGLKANFINSFLNTKKIATQHGQTSHSFKMKIMEFIENRKLAQMDQVILVSNEMFNDSSLKNKILVENFVPNLTEEKINFEKKSPFKIIYVGRLSKEKGIEFLLNSIDLEQEIELEIYGSGDLENFVTQQVSEKIKCKGFTKDIKNILKTSNLLIIPSQREGLPLIALEAVSLGLPVLATRVGGLPKLLKDEQFLFDYGNGKMLNQKVEYIINNYDQVIQSFEKIKQETVDTYSKSKWINSIQQIYQRLS